MNVLIFLVATIYGLGLFLPPSALFISQLPFLFRPWQKIGCFYGKVPKSDYADYAETVFPIYSQFMSDCVSTSTDKGKTNIYQYPFSKIKTLQPFHHQISFFVIIFLLSPLYSKWDLLYILSLCAGPLNGYFILLVY